MLFLRTSQTSCDATKAEDVTGLRSVGARCPTLLLRALSRCSSRGCLFNRRRPAPTLRKRDASRGSRSFVASGPVPDVASACSELLCLTWLSLQPSQTSCDATQARCLSRFPIFRSVGPGARRCLSWLVCLRSVQVLFALQQAASDVASACSESLFVTWLSLQPSQASSDATQARCLLAHCPIFRSVGAGLRRCLSRFPIFRSVGPGARRAFPYPTLTSTSPPWLLRVFLVFYNCHERQKLALQDIWASAIASIVQLRLSPSQRISPNLGHAQASTTSLISFPDRAIDKTAPGHCYRATDDGVCLLLHARSRAPAPRPN